MKEEDQIRYVNTFIKIFKKVPHTTETRMLYDGTDYLVPMKVAEWIIADMFLEQEFLIRLIFNGTDFYADSKGFVLDIFERKFKSPYTSYTGIDFNEFLEHLPNLPIDQELIYYNLDLFQ